MTQSHSTATGITHVPWLILGAGPTGLGAAYQLAAYPDQDWLLLEAAPEAGGLCASFKDPNGFVWDIGGHVLFSHYDYFDRAMQSFLGDGDWLDHQRESWIWMRNRFIPYPLQNNIHRLPPDDLYRCLLGLLDIARGPQSKPANFREWIEATFGRGLADIFMIPYNEKVWAYPPETLSAHWIGERVAVTDLARVLKNLVYQSDDIAWGPNNTFRFPREGGTGAIWRACADRLPAERLRFNTRAEHIDLDRRRVTTADGRVFGFDRLVTTIPLPDLIRISGQDQWEPLAQRGLRHSASHIVGLGLRGRPRAELAPKCWMYFPESDNPFYRVTVFSNYAPSNVPDHRSQWSLLCEVAESEHKPVDRARLVDDVIAGALATRLIERREDIIDTWTYRAEYGYPTPSLYRDEALDAIVPGFEKREVYSRGRFGLWKYEVGNQDHSFMQGVELVERLLNGSEEVTAFAPGRVNAGKQPWPYEKKMINDE